MRVNTAKNIDNAIGCSVVVCGLLISGPALALYEDAGWVADIPPGAHNVEAMVTVIDERTIHVEHFTYDGTAPAVYFYLGETDSDMDFANGLQLEPHLDRAYDDESLTLHLPEGLSLDDYGAISVWCAQFDVNFSSASFEAPAETYARAGWFAEMAPGAHDAQGIATIINERIIFIEEFTYDGTAPAVYFYLGEDDSQSSFENGLELTPQLDRAFVSESVVRTLPDGEALDGWGAISVWCAQFNANFTSATFVSPCTADVDGSGAVDVSDLLAVLAAWGGSDQSADLNDDGVVDVTDLLELLAAWGPCA
jgi:hypothetical protein